MAELLKEFEPDIESFALIPSDGGSFEVSVNEKIIYSKLQSYRHAEQGEVAGLVRKILREGI